MASLPNQAPKARRLRELLEERQEPFVLDVYLLEKLGHSKKIHSSDTACKEGWLSSVLKQREGFPKCPKLMKSVLAKVLIGKASKTSNCDRKANDLESFGNFCYDSDVGRETQVVELHQFPSAIASDNGSFSSSVNANDVERETKVAEMDRSSSASYTTVFDSCSDVRNMEEFPSGRHNLLSSDCSFGVLKLINLKDKASASGGLQSMEESKQFSPVSVLDIPFDEGSPVYNQKQFFHRVKRRNPTISSFNLDKEITKDTFVPTSILEILVKSLTEQEERHGFSSSSVCVKKSERMRPQKRKLLLDCVREVVEIDLERGTGSQLVLESVEFKSIEKIVLDQIFSWEKQGGSIKNITQILSYGMMETAQKWDQFQPEKTNIQIEIADVIFEELTNEIVVDMLDFFCIRKMLIV